MSQPLLAPIGIWLFQRQTRLSEKAIKKYYEDINRQSLLKDLANALGELVGNHDHLKDIFKWGAVSNEGSVLYWGEDSFTRWITTSQPHSVFDIFVPTLWHVFVYFASFPFTERIFNDLEGPAPHQRIGEDGFLRAYNLLALRGVELLGNTKDGCTPGGSVEKNWSQKLLRLASLMFDGLKVSSSEVDRSSQGFSSANFMDRSEEQLMNAIVLTQPVPYMVGVSFENELRQVARRLVIDNMAPSFDETVSFALLKHDLQTIIQFSLLLRIKNSPWTRGLNLDNTIQMCGDIEELVFASDQEEILLAARLADALIQHTVRNVDLITWQLFETLYVTYPNLVLRFYQLWTAIFIVHPSTSSSEDLSTTGLLNCAVQFLSVIGPVKFSSFMPTNAKLNEEDRQLQLDLQNAILVADSISTPALDEVKLVERLTNDQWFHFLVISTEEMPETASSESTERIITLFTSSLDYDIFYESPPVGIKYGWKYGLVQLLPYIFMSETGGLSVSFQHGVIKFSPHNDPSHESSITVDLKNNTVLVEWTGMPLLRLKLKSLKCYQLPGTAVKFIPGPPSIRR